MTHATTVERVRDQRGYDMGWAAQCKHCGWSADLRESVGTATHDAARHLKLNAPKGKDTHGGQ